MLFYRRYGTSLIDASRQSSITLEFLSIYFQYFRNLVWLYFNIRLVKAFEELELRKPSRLSLINAPRRSLGIFATARHYPPSSYKMSPLFCVPHARIADD